MNLNIIRNRSSIFKAFWVITAHNVVCSIRPVESIISLLVNIGSDSKPYSFEEECRARFNPCMHAFHHTDLKDPDIHVLNR